MKSDPSAIVDLAPEVAFGRARIARDDDVVDVHERASADGDRDVHVSGRRIDRRVGLGGDRTKPHVPVHVPDRLEIVDDARPVEPVSVLGVDAAAEGHVARRRTAAVVGDLHLGDAIPVTLGDGDANRGRGRRGLDDRRVDPHVHVPAVVVERLEKQQIALEVVLRIRTRGREVHRGEEIVARDVVVSLEDDPRGAGVELRERDGRRLGALDGGDGHAVGVRATASHEREAHEGSHHDGWYRGCAETIPQNAVWNTGTDV